jgi:hypothetical protein
MENEITAEEIAQHYSAMGDSVDLINGIIDGSLMADDTQEEEQPVIKIDDKEYKRNELDDNQVALVNKLAQIQQNKNSLSNQMTDLEILSKVYLDQLKESLKPKEEEEK